MPEKKFTKKNNPTACGACTEFIFPKKSKKDEKTDFEQLQKAQISFHKK
jgi:hypothetical protein